jgi:hypothetical protein
MSETASDTPPPLTDGFLDEIRALSELAITQRDDENAPYLDTADSLVLDVPRLLAEVDRLRAHAANGWDLVDTYVNQLEIQAAQWGATIDERDALAAKLAAVEKVIEPSDWKPLTERHPEWFEPDSPEEAARKKGWKQGVDLLTQQLRAVLGETGGTER